MTLDDLTDAHMKFLGTLCRYPGGVCATVPYMPNCDARPTEGVGFDLAEMGLADLISHSASLDKAIQSTHWSYRVNDLGKSTFRLLTGARCYSQDGRLINGPGYS